MKILIVASNMVHINNFHRPYIEAFREEGHDVLIMAHGEGADFQIPFKKRSMSLKNLLLSAKIKKIIKKEKFDAVYLHTTLAAFWVRLAIKGIKNRPLVINTVHGYLFGKGFSRLHNKIYLACERLVSKVTDNIVVMNDEDLEIASKNNLCLGKIYKIDGMGIDFSKKNLKIANPSFPYKNLIYVGELNKRKNQIFLARAMTHMPDTTLTLVGDGKERKAIEKFLKKEKIQDRVRITGFTKNVGDYLSQADLYVSASKIEGLPFNILEAMYSGLPVIATNIKGQCDILPIECLYSVNDMDSFLSLINKKVVAEYQIERYALSSVLSKNMEIYKQCARAGVKETSPAVR